MDMQVPHSAILCAWTWFIVDLACAVDSIHRPWAHMSFSIPIFWIFFNSKNTSGPHLLAFRHFLKKSQDSKILEYSLGTTYQAPKFPLYYFPKFSSRSNFWELVLLYMSFDWLRSYFKIHLKSSPTFQCLSFRIWSLFELPFLVCLHLPFSLDCKSIVKTRLNELKVKELRSK